MNTAMADATAAGTVNGTVDGTRPRRRGRLAPLVLGGLGALAAGGAMFWAVDQGLVPPPVAAIRTALTGPPAPPWAAWQTPVYVELPVITVSLGAEARARHLRTRLTLEVAEGAARPVAEAEPRVVATLVRLLRAVDERDFEQPALMLRLQAQMLRRVRLVTPPDSVEAVLIQEFMID